jgi:hypothetical protein
MTTARRHVEPNQATARPVLAIHIDIEQLIEPVRRHVPLSPMAARAIRKDFAALFDTSRVTVVTSAPTRKTKAAAMTPN